MIKKKKTNAIIVADSIDERGNRITTYLLTYWRAIHAELLTHRMFTRNAASSRAIPFAKMVKDIQEDPFIPIVWQKDHKGMQGNEYLGGSLADCCESDWLKARDNSILMAKCLNTNGATKQLCNRLLEPFQWYTCLVTFTEGDNFFELRCPKYMANGKCYKSKKDAVKDNDGYDKVSDLDWLLSNDSQAEIHIQALAEVMWDARNQSVPKELKSGEWHIPFEDKLDLMEWLEVINADGHLDGDLDTQDELFSKDKLKIATARCARLSYMTFDGDIDYEKDIKLHDQLLDSKHFSPFEHCARVMSDKEYYTHIKGEIKEDELYNSKSIYGWCNNFRGFVPYRYILEND